MNYLNAFLIIFILYIPIYFITLILLLKQNHYFSITKTTISSLALLEGWKDNLFSMATLLYGVLSIFSIIKYLYIYGLSAFTIIAAMSLFVVSIGTALAGLIQLDFNKSLHYFIAKLLFSSLIVTEILFSISYLFIDISVIISVVSVFLLILTIILIIRAWRNLGKGRKFASLEWSVLIGTMIWNILFAISLLD